MKTLIMSDLFAQRSALGQMAFILVLVDVIMLVCMQSPEGALAGVAVMVPYLMCYGLAVGDEMSGWERMRLTLPMGRDVVVRSRYASVILIAIATCVLAFILNVVLLAVIGAIPQLSGWLGGMAFTSEKVLGMLASSVLAFAMCLLFCSFTLPFMFRYGITRATRFIPVLAVVVMLVVFAALSDSTGFVAALDAMSPFLLLGLTLLVSVVVCVASIVLAARLLEHREF